jgi:hypothetical protein
MLFGSSVLKSKFTGRIFPQAEHYAFLQTTPLVEPTRYHSVRYAAHSVPIRCFWRISLPQNCLASVNACFLSRYSEAREAYPTTQELCAERLRI